MIIKNIDKWDFLEHELWEDFKRELSALTGYKYSILELLEAYEISKSVLEYQKQNALKFKDKDIKTDKKEY